MRKARSGKPRRSVVLVFGEHHHDRQAIRHLAEGLRPDLAGMIEPRRQPLVLIKGAAPAGARSNAEKISAVVRAEARARDVLAVLAHQDCDDLEPAHEPTAKTIEDELVRARCPAMAIGVTPAWEIEAWWMLFPEAVGCVVEGWRDPDDWIGKDVGQVPDAKERLRRAVRPRPAPKSPPRDYVEADSIPIASNIVKQGLLPSFTGAARVGLPRPVREPERQAAPRFLHASWTLRAKPHRRERRRAPARAPCYAAHVLDYSLLSPEGPQRISRQLYDRMVSLGLLDDLRVELLHGAIIGMTPNDPSHASPVDLLNEILAPALRGRARVRIQQPYVAADESEPEPDVAVVPLADYDRAHPDRAHLLIEVAGSSLRKDRLVKAPLYAVSSVAEYWIVNVGERVFEVHRGPAADGWSSVTRHPHGDTVAIEAFRDIRVRIADVIR